MADPISAVPGNVRIERYIEPPGTRQIVHLRHVVGYQDYGRLAERRVQLGDIKSGTIKEGGCLKYSKSKSPEWYLMEEKDSVKPET